MSIHSHDSVKWSRAQVQLPRAGTHELYILYSLSADQARSWSRRHSRRAASSLPLPIIVFALRHPAALRVTAKLPRASKETRRARERAGTTKMATGATNALASSLQDTISLA